MKPNIKRILILLILLTLLIGCSQSNQDPTIPDSKPEVTDKEDLPETPNNKEEPIVNEEKPNVNEEKPVVNEEEKKEPVITKKAYTKNEVITFKTITVNDNTLDSGKKVTKVKGQNGSKTIHYEITYKDGIKVSDKKIREEVINKPIDQVINIGTKVADFDGKKLGQELMNLINTDRKKNNAEPLIWSESLYKGASIRSDEIIIKFSHTRPNGQPPNTVASGVYGENIAAGQPSADIVHQAFQASQGHRENNMNPRYKTIGISASKDKNGTLYWAVLFGY